MKVIISRNQWGKTSASVEIDEAENPTKLQAGLRMYAEVSKKVDAYIQARAAELAGKKKPSTTTKTRMKASGGDS